MPIGKIWPSIQICQACMIMLCVICILRGMLLSARILAAVECQSAGHVKLLGSFLSVEALKQGLFYCAVIHNICSSEKC